MLEFWKGELEAEQSFEAWVAKIEQQWGRERRLLRVENLVFTRTPTGRREAQVFPDTRRNGLRKMLRKTRYQRRNK